MGGEDDWLREDLRELKGTLAVLGKDVNAVLLRVVGVEHRLGTAEDRIEKLREADTPATREVTTPGAAIPKPPRIGVLEAFGDSQVRLLTRPVIGPIVGLFYLAVLAGLLGALLGVPASQVRAWWSGPDAEQATDDDDANTDDVKPTE